MNLDIPGVICPECGKDHAVVRAVFRSSIYATAVGLCGFNAAHYQHVPNETFHKRALDWLQKKIEGGSRRILVLWPRDHLKTSTITISASIWQIIRDRNTRGFILHRLPRESEKFLNAVRSILVSDVFVHYFPDISPIERIGKATDELGNPVRWKKDEIDVLRDRYHPQATLTAKGLRSAFEGSHPTWVIADDLVDREVASSPLLMARAIRFREQISSILEDPKTGLFLVVGTLWPGGFYEGILENDEYEKFVAGCYQDERTERLIGLADYGEPIFPERFSKRDLERIEKEMGAYTFAHQYLNVAKSKASAGFSAEDFRFCTVDEENGTISYESEDGDKVVVHFNELDGFYMTVDPATGFGKDESAIVVCGTKMRTGQVFLVDRFRGYPSPGELVERMLRMAQKWNVKAVGIEAFGYQRFIKNWLVKRMAETGVQIRVVELSHRKRSKNERIIESFHPWIESRRFFVRRKFRDVVDQALAWNPEAREQRDDLLDAIAYQPALWNLYAKPQRPRPAYADDDEIDVDVHAGSVAGVRAPLYGWPAGGRNDREIQDLTRGGRLGGIPLRSRNVLSRLSRRRFV